MEKKDFKVTINNTKLDALDPHTKRLLLDLKRHFNGIMYSVARWALATQVKNKST